MIRVFIANSKAQEISALRFMLLDLNMEMVGGASNWSMTIENAPKTRLNMLLIDWDLLPQNAIASIAKLRKACANEVVVVLTSYLDAREQAALSTGADIFISKGETSKRLANQLRAIAKNFQINETLYLKPKK